MPSLRSINKEAGTNFRRWKELTEAVTIEEAKPSDLFDKSEKVEEFQANA